MEAPKRLWHPVVVVVDEAHKFAPEKDESEASDAMIALTTDGRKRQFCAVCATQRLGKLSKDAAAELLNVMIGGTVLDIDRKRAAEALGVYGKDSSHSTRRSKRSRAAFLVSRSGDRARSTFDACRSDRDVVAEIR